VRLRLCRVLGSLNLSDGDELPPCWMAIEEVAERRYTGLEVCSRSGGSLKEVYEINY